MKKKQKEMQKNISDLIDDVKSQISSATVEKIPDIMTFCDDPAYLNIKENPGNPIDLFPMQRIILETFYRGSDGNEDLKLTEEELGLLKEKGAENVIKKYESDERFRELILVLGRRSGKNLLVGLMAAYEAMRLLEVPGGNPFTHYGLKEGNPIYILTVASSEEQARVLFNEIKSALLTSTYFMDKIGFIESSSIHLLTW